MRAVLLLLPLTCSACGPTAEENALISKVESTVVLPKGAGSLACYERHYALLRGDQVQEYIGPLKIDRMLVGRYIPSDKPGVHWERNADHLPKIYDAGCGLIEVFYAVGIDKSPRAFCATNLAGVSPEVVEPPRSC